MIYQRQRKLKLLGVLRLAVDALKILKDIQLCPEDENPLSSDQSEEEKSKVLRTNPKRRAIRCKRRKRMKPPIKSEAFDNEIIEVTSQNENQQTYCADEIINFELNQILKNEDITINNTVSVKIEPIVENEKKKKRRSCSVQSANLNRHKTGFFVTVFKQLKEFDEGGTKFFFYTNMNQKTFDAILKKVQPFLQKTSIREPILPDCRLAVTLHYCTHYISVSELAKLYQMGKGTIRSIILETSDALWTALGLNYLKQPTVLQYRDIAEDFNNIWNMPNCIGAIGGRHITLRQRSKIQYKNINNKYTSSKYCSIVLLGISDAKYRFSTIDIGPYGNYKDGGNFQQSEIGKHILNNRLPIPQRDSVENSEIDIPYYFAVDSAFPLAPNIMRPYPDVPSKKENDAFNERLSHANKAVENAFGILLSRWHVLLGPMNMLPENAKRVVLACVVLHNYLMVNEPEETGYCSDEYVDHPGINCIIKEGLWRSEIKDGAPPIVGAPFKNLYGGNFSTKIRNNLRDFLNSYEAFSLDY